jgi:hypothetical protein
MAERSVLQTRPLQLKRAAGLALSLLTVSTSGICSVFCKRGDWRNVLDVFRHSDTDAYKVRINAHYRHNNA